MSITFEDYARQIYGNEIYAAILRRANPGIGDIISDPNHIFTPDILDKPQDLQTIFASNEAGEVSILINNQRFRFWTRIQISRSIDTIDRVTFEAPFEPENIRFRSLFKPFSYSNITVILGGEVLFKGVIMSVSPNVEERSKTITVSCYAKCGVLNDCTMPSSSFPLEFNNTSLENITQSLCEPFGISYKFNDNSGAIFSKVSCSPTEKILRFLSKLASQRNLILSNDEQGALVFQSLLSTGAPSFILEQSSPPLLSVTPQFRTQEYFSHITGISDTRTGQQGGQYVVKNTHLSHALRPQTISINDTENADLKKAVDTKISRMFGNMASYSVRISTWFNHNNHLLKPADIVRLHAPDAMIYNPYDFIIRSIEFNQDDKSQTARLELSMVGAFSGNIPQSLPWD